MAKKRKLPSTSTPKPSKEAKKEEPPQQQQEEEQVEYNNPVEEEEQVEYNNPVEEEEQVKEEMGADEEEGEDQEEEEEEEGDDDEEETLKDENNLNTGVGTSSNVEEDNDDGDEEVFENLIEPFTKTQLSDLLKEAAEKHPDVLESIRKLADVDPVHRKIFVHGLGWDTTAETLVSVFRKYGEIEDCKAVCDKISGKSKGYAFILFKRRSSAKKALKEPQKKIGNRMTACQLASAGPAPAPAPAPAAAISVPPVSEYTARKIYVSNVGPEVDPQKLLAFFSRFGDIEEGPLGLDKVTGKPKGFALFVYRSTEGAKKALEEPHKTFDGTVLHCQKAVDGPKPGKPYFTPHQSNPQGGAHGRSGRGLHYPRNDNHKYSGGAGSHMPAALPTGGHLMAQPYNPGHAQGLNPVLGQALTALLASQGGAAGLGMAANLFGLGAPVNPSVQMQGGYGSQPSALGSSAMAGYGSQPGVQGGYQNPQMGQPNAGRSQQGGGHMGGIPPYMGH